jgi:K+-sensing histidine kinase KdpD
VDERFPDPTAAVMAHGLLNSMAIIRGAARTLQEAWESLGPEQRAQLLSMVADQADHVASMLGELARGLPMGVLQELESLSEGHQPR